MVQETDEFALGSWLDEAIDFEYEFDAPQYFDFCVPETDWEAEEVERWFESADSDPPSPIIIKLNLGIDLELTSSSESCKDGDTTTCTSSDCGSTLDGNLGGLMKQGTPKAKDKSSIKPTSSRCSTLMKPTASHLAKLNQLVPLRRLQKSSCMKDGKTAQSSLLSECPASKRQKLEAGYLHKVAQLKHQILLLHKVSEKTSLINIVSVRPKPKVTIPKEFELITAHRAQIRRSKKNLDSPEHAIPNANTSKARPMNRKILQSSLSLPKNITAELSEFQGMNVPNSISSHDGTAESRRQNMVDATKQEKCERSNKLRSCSLNMKDLKFSSDKRPEHEPPVELFSKLSLASKVHRNSRSQPKVSAPTKMINGFKGNQTVLMGSNFNVGGAIKSLKFKHKPELTGASKFAENHWLEP